MERERWRGRERTREGIDREVRYLEGDRGER